MNRRQFLEYSAVALGLASCGPMVRNVVDATPTARSLGEKDETGEKLGRSWRWGVFTGGDEETIEVLESRIGARTDLVKVFIGGQDLIPRKWLDYAAREDKELLVFWEPQLNLSQIAQGELDEPMKDLGQQIKNYGRRVTLFPMPEFNLPGLPWSADEQNRGEFGRAYRRVMVAGGFDLLPNVRRGLSVNSWPAEMLEGNVPEAEQVDVVGVSGFNFGPPQEEWLSFEYIAGSVIDESKRLVKGVPVMVSSVGCAPSREGGQSQAEWFDQALTFMEQQRIKEVSIFAENKEGQSEWERNWKLEDETVEVLGKRLGISS